MLLWFVWERVWLFELVVFFKFEQIIWGNPDLSVTWLGICISYRNFVEQCQKWEFATGGGCSLIVIKCWCVCVLWGGRFVPLFSWEVSFLDEMQANQWNLYHFSISKKKSKVLPAYYSNSPKFHACTHISQYVGFIFFFYPQRWWLPFGNSFPLYLR